MVLGLALALGSPAAAQDYRFPASDDHYPHYYVTAYYDHSGVDWNCGTYQYSGHRGNDFGVGSWSGMDAGRDLVAAAAGTVLAAHDGEYDRCSTGDCEGGSGFGNYVKIQHADGKITYYAHMKQWSVAVTTGQAVSCGTRLGQVGSSGYSTGPHLHFEVRDASGTQGDPFDGSCSHPPSWWVSQGSYMGLPAAQCEDVAPCTSAGTLACGQAVSGRNDGTGATNAHAWYGCTEWTYSGAEIAWSFSTGLSEPVTLSLTGLSADLDIYVLESDACDGSGCVAASDGSETSDETLTFDAVADHVYTVVLDGWEGASSGFTLAAACDGGGGDPADTAALDSGDAPPDREDGWPGPGVRTPMTGAGGCAAAGPGGTPRYLPLVGLLLLVRRRPRVTARRCVL